MALAAACALAGCDSEKSAQAPTPETAAALILARAKAGDPNAQMLLGQMHRLGEGVPRDANASAYWYRQAAQQGLPDAQHNWAVALQHGFGVPANLPEAARWHQQAAMQGVPAAQYDLGRMYLFGKGVSANATRAFHWFDEAGRHSHRQAIFHLALMSRDGNGTRRDLVQAGKFLLMATELGLLDAQAEYHLLAPSLSAQQRTAAETQAREAMAGLSRGPAMSSPLILRAGLFYAPGQQQPYSGRASLMHTNGVRAKEMEVKQGRLHGWERTWHPNGQPQGQMEYRDGQRHGLISTWYPNGQAQLSGTNQHGQLLNASAFGPDGKPAGAVRAGNGTLAMYHANGTRAGRWVYESGRLTKEPGLPAPEK